MALTTELERARTTCTFCRMGCELEVIRQGWRLVGVEYPADSQVSQGRLCPRGSASALLLDHPMRLAYPLKDGREKTWDEFFFAARETIRNCPSNELAVLYDGNLTEEELRRVSGFANFLGTDNLCPSRVESEQAFNLKLELKPQAKGRSPSDVTLADLSEADTILMVGDVFGAMPVLSKPVLDSKYASRDRRLYHVDCVKSQGSGLASRFLWVEPGLEPLILLSIAGLVDKKLSGFDPEAVALRCRVRADDIREIAAGFDKAKKAIVVAAITSGRTLDPKLLSLASQLLVSRAKGSKRLLLAGERLVPAGARPLSELLAAVSAKRLRVVFRFGETAGWGYSGLEEHFRPVEFQVSTSTHRPREVVPGWVLPVPMNLEKSGTVSTVWGPARLNAVQPAASGTRTIAQIVEGVAGYPIKEEDMPDAGIGAKIPTKSVTERGRAGLKREQGNGHGASGTVQGEERFTLLTEKPAYEFRGIFQSDAKPVLISRVDAARLGIEDGTLAQIETDSGRKAALVARISDRVRPYQALVNANHPAISGLFDVKIDSETGMATVPPVKAKLWRSE